MFGEKIESDPAFAEEVVFYLSALQAFREQLEAGKKQRYREIYQKHEASGNSKKVIKLVSYLAAVAVVAGIVFGLYFFTKPVST